MSDTKKNKKKSKGMFTWIRIYDLIGMDCPSNMSVENCPLRQELAKMPKINHIGYETLPDGDLMLPYYLPTNDVTIGSLGSGCIHVPSLCTRICGECRNKKR